jgi:endonuclease YncB( thermonuclease family)
MSRKSVALLISLIALSSTSAVAQAENPPADPVAVLKAAGLTLKNGSYVLAGEIEAESIRQKLDAIHTELARLEQQYLSRHPQYVKQAEATGSGSGEYQALCTLVSRMAEDMAEAWRTTQRRKEVVNRIPDEYRKLADDPQVKAALRALNKGRHPAFTLGPIAAYQRNILNQSVELLSTLGYHREGNLFWLEEEAGLVDLGVRIYSLWQQVAVGGPATLAQGTTKPLTGALLSARRVEFVQRVRELRRRVGAVQERRDALLAAGEASDAVIEINRFQGRLAQVSLGTNPRLGQVLKNLEAMEQAIPSLTDASRPAGPGPPAPIPDPAPDLPPAPPDLNKLPRYKVLRVADGDTVEVHRMPGTMSVRLLGVVAPGIDSPLLRARFLGELLNGQAVALVYDPGAPLDHGRTVAQVYRVPDGLFVNLKMVQEGYGVPAENAPESLQAALLAAEQEARAAQRGLWSPAAKVESAALEREKKRQHEESSKRLKETMAKKAEAKGQLRKRLEAAIAGDERTAAAQSLQLWAWQRKGVPLGNLLEAIVLADEQTAKQSIALWEQQYKPQDPSTIRQAHLAYLARLEAERKQREEEERRRAPEINAGPAAVAMALLVAGVLMLADRRRRGAA